MWLAEQLTGAKFEVEEQQPGGTILRCEGIGYSSVTIATESES